MKYINMIQWKTQRWKDEKKDHSWFDENRPLPIISACLDLSRSKMPDSLYTPPVLWNIFMREYILMLLAAFSETMTIWKYEIRKRKVRLSWCESNKRTLPFLSPLSCHVTSFQSRENRWTTRSYLQKDHPKMHLGIDASWEINPRTLFQLQNSPCARGCKDLRYLILSSLTHDVQNQSIRNALRSRDRSPVKLFGNWHFHRRVGRRILVSPLDLTPYSVCSSLGLKNSDPQNNRRSLFLNCLTSGDFFIRYRDRVTR
jgi:hypothetical protein